MATTRTCQTSVNLDLEEKEDSSSEDEEESHDAMLGGLRLGISTIRKHTRSAVAKSETAESKKDMISRIEESTLSLIRGEKMFLQTATIVAGIVDDVITDSEEDDDVVFDPNANQVNEMTKLEFPGPEKLLLTREKMAVMLDDRMKSYEASLTKLSLETHPKYVALQKQITLGEEDYARSHDQAEVDCHGGTDSETHGIQCAPQIPDIDYGEESDGNDETVLPSKDPISKKYIMNPVRNKHCNHVFEEDSILDFIMMNPGCRCPMFRCVNPKPVEKKDLVKNKSLTARIRNKNTSCHY